LGKKDAIVAILGVAGCNSGNRSTTGNGGLNCGQSGGETTLANVDGVAGPFEGFVAFGLGISRYMRCRASGGEVD
jgi:hypothetical protein